MIEKLKGGIIISCYAGNDYPGDINPEMANPTAMAYVANSCVAGGASAIRTNWANLKAIREMVDVPVIGIHKVAHPEIPYDFRITPTMKEVDMLVKDGADAIAIDGTMRPRYDDLTLEEFIHQIKEKSQIVYTILATLAYLIGPGLFALGVNTWRNQKEKQRLLNDLSQ